MIKVRVNSKEPKIGVLVNNHGANNTMVRIGGQAVNISEERQPVLQRLDATENGLYNTLPSGVDGWYPVNVNVPTPSGNIELQQAEQTNVSAYATATVKRGTTGTPSITPSSVVNHSKTFTPTVTNSVGFIDGGTKTGESVTVSASDLVSGQDTITRNGTYTVTNLNKVVVNVNQSLNNTDMYVGSSVPSGIQAGNYWIDISDESGVPQTITAGNTPVLTSNVMTATINTTTVKATGIYIIIPKAGTYRFKFSCARTSTSGTYTTQLYKNGSAIDGATASWSQRQGSCTVDIQCDAEDRIEIYSRTNSASMYSATYTIVGQLIACINWDIWG